MSVMAFHYFHGSRRTGELTRRRDFIQASPDQFVSTARGSGWALFHAPAARVQRFVRHRAISGRADGNVFVTFETRHHKFIAICTHVTVASAIMELTDNGNVSLVVESLGHLF